MQTKENNTITILAMSGLILTLALWNIAGWALTYGQILWAAVLVCLLAFFSEVLAANQAIEAERNWDKARAKAFGNLAALLVFGAINTAGSHNAWHQFEALLLAPVHRAQLQAYETQLATLNQDLADAETRVQELERRIDSLPTPDPRDITSRQQAAAEFYQVLYQPLADRLAAARTDLTKAEQSIEDLTPERTELLPSWAVWFGFGALELVKAIGFWALSNRRIGFVFPITPTMAGSALVRCRPDRRKKPT
jgi:hypothetical protein